MKLNIAFPVTGRQQTVEIDDHRKLLPFFEKRMGAEVPGDSLGDEFKGYVFRISGGNDKQGFPMMHGVLTNHRVRLLFKEGMPCYRPRRTGERKRKSVRGCVVGPDLAALNLVLIKKGDEEIPGLTDTSNPTRLGPKRANKIRKLFNLSKTDDVKPFVVRRKIEGPKGTRTKAPKIQRLITEERLRRKRRYKAELARRGESTRKQLEEYKKVVEAYRLSQKAKTKTPGDTKKKQGHKKVAAK